ncbi:MAG: UDP-3-O-acyl-N-acetylglucosamine deacetylase [Elusimicrobiota bacterium]|jgi:UDP-3-O-acyl N-acetylglucosamine deacetylase
MRDHPECQSTLREPVTLEGIGLHTGNPSRITFLPAPPDAGLRFIRADLPGKPVIPARLGFVVTTVRGTNIGLGEAKVHTVEHVLAALTGIGIDNADIEVTANEPPAMDGSALPFFQALTGAGIHPYPDHPKRYLHIPEEIVYADQGSSYRAVPAENFEITATLIHDHPLVPRLTLTLRPDPEIFLSQIAAARTFCFEHEIAFLRELGLAQGGSLENAVVICPDRIMTDAAGLRFPDEFVRHKLLDLIGDMTLIGRSLFRMRLEVVRPGHAHNIEFARRLSEAAMKMRGRIPMPTGGR